MHADENWFFPSRLLKQFLATNCCGKKARELRKCLSKTSCRLNSFAHKNVFHSCGKFSLRVKLFGVFPRDFLLEWKWNKIVSFMCFNHVIQVQVRDSHSTAWSKTLFILIKLWNIMKTRFSLFDIFPAFQNAFVRISIATWMLKMLKGWRGFYGVFQVEKYHPKIRNLLHHQGSVEML